MLERGDGAHITTQGGRYLELVVEEVNKNGHVVGINTRTGERQSIAPSEHTEVKSSTILPQIKRSLPKFRW